MELDAQVNELLGLMLHKAQLSKSDLMQEFVARWVSQNFDDLLSETEQKPFKNLFYYAKQTEAIKDIQAALDDFTDLDIEDTFQFVVSQKMRRH